MTEEDLKPFRGEVDRLKQRFGLSPSLTVNQLWIAVSILNGFPHSRHEQFLMEWSYWGGFRDDSIENHRMVIKVLESILDLVLAMQSNSVSDEHFQGLLRKSYSRSFDY